MSSMIVSCLNRSIKLDLLAATALIAIVATSVAAQAGVLISSGATSDITCTSGVCTPTKKNAILNVTQLQNLLASGNVTVTTDGSKASDITIRANLSWASAYGLTLDAYESIAIDKVVSVDGTGSLTLTTNDGGTGGALSFGKKSQVTFLSTANSLTINGAAYTLVADTTTLASDVAANPGGNYALAGDYDASGNSSFVSTTLTGRFEGLGNTISHLSLTASQANFGLFAEVAASGAITDTRLAGVSISGGGQAEGSLVGLNQGSLSGDSTSGNVHVLQSGGGGLVGDNQGSVTTCFSSVKIGGSSKEFRVALGSLVGLNEATGTINESYATGSVSSRGQDDDGGLVGMNVGAISNSYATGSVTGAHKEDVGGLVGWNTPDEPGTGTISNSYSTGAVSGGSGSTVGGLIGFDYQATGVISSYWDTTTSGITNPSQGTGSISNAPGITGLSTSQLQAGLPAGFSSTTWGESSSINGGLPYLLALPPAK